MKYEDLSTEQMLQRALDRPEERVRLIAEVFAREYPDVFREGLNAVLRAEPKRGRPRKQKDRGFSGDDPAFECIAVMEYLNRVTGETKAQTLARTALDGLLEGGFVTVGNRQYWTLVERLARLWKERVEAKKEKVGE